MLLDACMYLDYSVLGRIAYLLPVSCNMFGLGTKAVT